MYKKMLLGAIVGLSLAGCASDSVVAPNQYSGFLGDYSNLQEATSPEGAPVMRWISPSLKPGMYTNVLLDPSVFYPQPQPSAQVSMQALNSITSQFDANLKNAVMSSGMQLVTSPGPNTLRISPAITAVKTSSAPLAAYQYVPIALVVTGAAAAAGEHDQQVQLTAEMKASDSQTNAVLAKVVRENRGEDLSNTSQQLTVSNAQPVLKTWANDLGNYLTQFK